MQVLRGDIVLHITGHHGDSYPGSGTMAEIKSSVVYHHLLQQKDYPFMRLELKKANWSDKVLQTEVTDPFGNGLMFIEACG